MLIRDYQAPPCGDGITRHDGSGSGWTTGEYPTPTHILLMLRTVLSLLCWCLILLVLIGIPNLWAGHLHHQYMAALPLCITPQWDFDTIPNKMGGTSEMPSTMSIWIIIMKLVEPSWQARPLRHQVWVTKSLQYRFQVVPHNLVLRALAPCNQSILLCSLHLQCQ